MSPRACFYLILAILNYFNLSSVFILTIMLLNFFLKSDLFLSYTNRGCTNLPRMSVGACFYLILAILNYLNLSSVFILTIMLLNFFLKSDLFLSYTNRCCTNLPRMSVGACFYLILAILNYFNLSSVFILTIMLLNFFLKSDLFLSYTDRGCTNLPRMSARACFYLILAILNCFNLSSVFILTIMLLNFFL